MPFACELCVCVYADDVVRYHLDENSYMSNWKCSVIYCMRVYSNNMIWSIPTLVASQFNVRQCPI